MSDQNESAPEEIEEEAASMDEDWERRTLCSDEACIGVIGPDGRCKECGKPYEGKLPDAVDADSRPDDKAHDPVQDAGPEEGVGPESPEEHDPEPADSRDDWENRRLCSDEACIGVIGPDGRCKECGRPYEGD